jgi:hypothetical protein
MKFLTMTWTTSEDSWANLAEVDISPAHARLILRQRDAFLALPFANVASIEFHDCCATFYNDVDLEYVLSETFARKLDMERHLEAPATWDGSGLEASRTSCDRLVIDQDGFYWVASDKYTSARVESELIPYGLIEALAKEDAEPRAGGPS